MRHELIDEYIKKLLTSYPFFVAEDWSAMGTLIDELDKLWFNMTDEELTELQNRPEIQELIKC